MRNIIFAFVSVLFLAGCTTTGFIDELGAKKYSQNNKELKRYYPQIRSLIEDTQENGVLVFLSSDTQPTKSLGVGQSANAVALGNQNFQTSCSESPEASIAFVYSNSVGLPNEFYSCISMLSNIQERVQLLNNVKSLIAETTRMEELFIASMNLNLYQQGYISAHGESIVQNEEKIAEVSSSLEDLSIETNTLVEDTKLFLNELRSKLNDISTQVARF